LSRHGIVLEQKKLEIPEPRSYDIEEIARMKSRYEFNHLQHPVATQDSGFFINAWNGYLRTFVNFTLETIGLEGILQLMKDTKDRSCEFRQCLTYMDEFLAEPIVFTEHVSGTIATEKRGTRQKHHWSDLALIYIPKGADKTHGEMTKEETSFYRETYRGETAGKMLGEWLKKNRKNH
jgi:XTP/dITP diphosphohydrolase